MRVETRRIAIPWLCAAALVCASACARSPEGPPSRELVELAMPVPPSQPPITPAKALVKLKQGNARFVAGQSLRRDLLAQVRATAPGQYPFASIVGCIDSRVPPELVFDQGIGDIFSARIAGNFVDDEILGSLEFASQLAGSRLIVVLGHTQCGAIKGACDDVHMGHLTRTLSYLLPAVDAVTGVAGPRSSKNAAFVEAVTDMNVRLTTAAIRERSPGLAALVASGDLGIVGAVYDVATGEVRFFDDAGAAPLAAVH